MTQPHLRLHLLLAMPGRGGRAVSVTRKFAPWSRLHQQALGPVDLIYLIQVIGKPQEVPRKEMLGL